jgi:hypothetical protein
MCTPQSRALGASVGRTGFEPQTLVSFAPGDVWFNGIHSRSGDSMSDTSAFGFGQFVPGFDFLKNLTQASQQAQPGVASAMPNMASWVAPTLSIEELDKRIQELKAVQFWLDQNATALKATIQAMEVQKMTLSTLQGMNVNMADLAKAFTAKVPTPASTAQPAAPIASSPEPEAALPDPVGAGEADAAATAEKTAVKPAVDPMQWWGSLTEQFQNIAAAALKDVAAQALKNAPKKPVSKAATKTAPKAAAKSAAKKSPARQPAVKAAAKKSAAPRKRA